jgi:hypothetical protein
MDRSFQIALVASVFAIAIVLFKYSENGRYQYSGSADEGIIVDTRSGEYWRWDGSHFEPRAALITFHHPSVDDQTVGDDRSNKFKDCLHDAVTHGKDTKACVAALKFDFQPEGLQPSGTSATSH